MDSDTMVQAREYVESKGGFLVKVSAAVEKIKQVAPINSDDQVAKDVGNAVGLLAGAGALAAIGLDLASLDLDLLVFHCCRHASASGRTPASRHHIPAQHVGARGGIWEARQCASGGGGRRVCL